MPPEPTSDFPPGVAKPAQRALASIGVTRLSDLTRYRRDELLGLHGFGPRALDAVDRALASRGLEFKK